MEVTLINFHQLYLNITIQLLYQKKILKFLCIMYSLYPFKLKLFNYENNKEIIIYFKISYF